MLLLTSVFNLCVQSCLSSYAEQKYPSANGTSDDSNQISTKAEQSNEMPLQDNLTGIFDGGGQLMDFSSASSFSSVSSSANFTRHLMCKDYTMPSYDPIDPTTTFSPSDKQAVILTDVNISNIIEFEWYDRDNSSKAWVSCYNWTEQAEDLSGYPDGPYHVAAYLSIAGYWPGVYFPRGYKVDVYLDGVFSFSEFFEVTNGGLDSPRTCENVDANGQPVNLKSRFTVGVDTQVSYYLRFDDMAYFDEDTGNSHNFTTVWIEPNGTIYKTHSSVFSDYKDNDVTLNYWSSGLVPNDSISIDSTTPVGNWEVQVYVDSYYSNGTWIAYGPIATTPFIVGNQSVPNWTFMVYIDSDNDLANGLNVSGQIQDLGIDVFLRLANVTSSPDFNVVVELARAPSQDERYGNWTGAKRFDVEEGMTPTAENAVEDLGNVDMGDPSTLRDFVNWTINNYPANYYFLVLWDHGSGCMGICYDTTSGNDYLSLPKLTQALTGIPAIMDDVFMDACGMSMLEVAYQIKDSANILIGPEGLGYGSNMPPYDAYLNNLADDPSISPTAFAQDIVMNYTSWAYANAPYISSAAMTATDLTKMTSLAAAVDDFAAALTEEETLYHEQISLARNMTTGYPGPYQNPDGTYQTGYYIDLYDFASLVNATVPDEELRNDSIQVMTWISNAVIMNLYINEPGTYGLAVFFPDEKGKYDTFATIYNETAFAINTAWNDFIDYDLAGLVLTIKTTCPNMPVKVDDDVYNATAEGEIDVFLQPGTHTVNVTSIFSPEPDSQLVFVNWTDGYSSNIRTFDIENSDLTAEAVYQLQYLLVLETNFGQTEPPVGQYWYNASQPVSVRAIAPSAGAGENYVELNWTIQEGAIPSSSTDNPILITMNGPINATATWTHEYLLTVTSLYGTPTLSTGWFDASTSLNASVTSPVSGSTGTQYVCIGWTGTGNVPSSGASLTANFTLDQPSSIQWIWKTQYLLTVNTDPIGLTPSPSVVPAASASWYDNGTTVTCIAQQINGYTFQQWSAQGAPPWDVGVNPINITMDGPGPYDLTANYVHTQTWWQILSNPNIMQALLAVVGTTLTLGLVGGTWFRSRKRRNITKAFLADVDDVYSRLKTYPKNCEDELYALRNTVLEGLTEGKITQENYDIIDKKIDKYVAELSDTQRRKRKAPAK